MYKRRSARRRTSTSSSSTAALSLFLDPIIREKDWSFFAFNGMWLRASKISMLFEHFDFDFVIETGTYLGASTEFLSRISQSRVYSIEKNSEFIEAARLRLSKSGALRNVELILGDSTFETKRIVGELSKTGGIIFAYFDAHWENELPLRDELFALINSRSRFVVVIDDFYVPTDKYYGFDEYQGVPINNQIADALDKLEVWIPSLPSYAETGAKRGTGYLFSHDVSKMLPSSFFEDLVRYPKLN